MKFLITGANGFIGSNLAIRIKNELKYSEINLFDIKFDKKSLVGQEFNMIEGDLLNVTSDSLPDVDVVIHAAALLGVNFVNSNPAAVVLENISSFLAMRKYLDNPKVKFVFFSTSEVYGDGQTSCGRMISNSTSMDLLLPDLSDNRSSYALSKIVGEYISSRSPNHINLRPHNLYGRDMGNKHVIPNLIEKIWHLKGDSCLEIFNPDHVRSFCHIDDAIDQILYLIQADQVGNFNVGNPHEPTKIIDLAQFLLTKMNKTNKITILAGTHGSPSFRRPEIDYIEKDFIDLDKGLDVMIREFMSSQIASMQNS